MLYDLGVCLAGLILFSPILAFGLAWAKIDGSYSNRQVQRRQKDSSDRGFVERSRLHWLLELACLSDISHHVAFIALLTLERLIYLSRAVSIAAIGCLVIGRGPYRVRVLLAVLWVTLPLWVHDGIIHWT